MKKVQHWLINSQSTLPEFLIAMLLILSGALSVSYDYYQKIDVKFLRSRIELHDAIIEGNAPSPYQYRVLVPFTTQIIRKTLGGLGQNSTDAFRYAYALYDFIAIAFSLFATYVYLRIWFRYEPALIGTLLLAILMPANFKYHYFQPWSLIEIGFFALGLYAIHQRKKLTLISLVILATLNRETGIFIPMLYGLSLAFEYLQDKSSLKGNAHRWLLGLITLGISIGLLIGLRLIFGNLSHVVNLSDLFYRNIQPTNLRRTAIAFSLFLGAFWLLIFFGFPKAPRFVKASLAILPFYLLTYLVWGAWYETRVLMPLYPVLIPVGLSAIFPISESKDHL